LELAADFWKANFIGACGCPLEEQISPELAAVLRKNKFHRKLRLSFGRANFIGSCGCPSEEQISSKLAAVLRKSKFLAIIYKAKVLWIRKSKSEVHFARIVGKILKKQKSDNKTTQI